MRARLSLALPVVAAFAALAPTAAEAANVDRRGFQMEGMFGVSACIPGKAECKRADSISDAFAGKTGPSFGMGFTLGFRPVKYFMIGAAYNLGVFNPDYRNFGGIDVYKSAYQNSLFGVLRAILPVWRLDLGLELAPGWSRQVFKYDNSFGALDKEYSQGFALKLGPVVDFYITRRVFIGAKVDFIFNFHRQVCSASDDGSRVCGAKTDKNQASVHQMIAGFHVGANF